MGWSEKKIFSGQFSGKSRYIRTLGEISRIKEYVKDTEERGTS